MKRFSAELFRFSLIASLSVAVVSYGADKRTEITLPGS
jgi:hypothetical protein